MNGMVRESETVIIEQPKLSIVFLLEDIRVLITYEITILMKY